MLINAELWILSSIEYSEANISDSYIVISWLVIDKKESKYKLWYSEKMRADFNFGISFVL